MHVTSSHVAPVSPFLCQHRGVPIRPYLRRRRGPSSPRRRAVTRLLWMLATGLVGAVVTASPASADPARPTNYWSEVTFLDPPTDAVRVDVVGGDAFVRIDVDPGHEVTVLGYYDEPYVRVLADGTVERNAASPAVALNESRYGSLDAQPAGNADSVRDTPPRWERVGSGGTYVWHDHRTHWMSTALPPQLGGEESGVVFEDWVVPLIVDGAEVEVHGMLRRDAPPSAVPWIALAVVVAAAVTAGVVVTHADRLTASGVALAIVGIAATALSAIGQFGLPAATGRQYHLVIVPVIATVAAVVGLAMRRTPSGQALVAGSALTVLFWVFGMFGVLVHAHAPTDPDETLQRVVIACALGAVLATAALAFLARVGPRGARARAGTIV